MTNYGKLQNPGQHEKILAKNNLVPQLVAAVFDLAKKDSLNLDYSKKNENLGRHKKEKLANHGQCKKSWPT